ncbi:hypothetical protein ACIA74_27580 [Streptomyces sp. NPDC051658]|uniref:hypothetical protein n=1 Tax=Streptomyces sp. NPDC051658 TaxID=3365667 RepID=UPI0037A259A7
MSSWATTAVNFSTRVCWTSPVRSQAIGLGETDTDAAEARAKAKDFRKFADDLETLADMMDATTSSDRDVASCPGGVSFCTGDSD